MCCLSQTYLDTDYEILRTSTDYGLQNSFIHSFIQPTCQALHWALDEAVNKEDVTPASWSFHSSGDGSNFSFFHLFIHLILISVNPVPDSGDRNKSPMIAALRSVAILDQEC